MPDAADLLIISNGHGEDAVGARLARAFERERPGIRIQAFPTVGEGHAYAASPATLVGSRASYPSGGFTFESVGTLLGDLRSGLVSNVVGHARALRCLRAHVVLAVGDVAAEVFSLVPRAERRHVVQTLITRSTHQGGAVMVPLVFRDRFTVLERGLMRMGFRFVYLRDEPSARWLAAVGVNNAMFAGNPMMDELDAPALAWSTSAPRVAVLPGSRDAAALSLGLIAQALARLPRASAAVAWVPPEDPPTPEGWSVSRAPDGGLAWQQGDVEVRFVRNQFASILQWAEMAVGTSGTAHEQAAGLAVPVVTFVLGGAHGVSYVAKQRRLLGGALEVVPRDPAAIAAALHMLAKDPAVRRARGDEGRVRMGPSGGSQRIARHILADAGLPPAVAT